MHAYFRSVLFLTLLCLTLPGCVSGLSETFGGGPAIDPNSESFADFLDVPYPAHMSYDKKESFSYDRRGSKAGVTVVSGKMNTDEVGAFYDQHLPPHGWSPVAEAQSTALASTWKKGDRYLTIVARPASFSLTTSSRVELWVGAPFTKDDLGKRVIYQKPTTGDDGSSSSSRSSDGGSGGMTEEDI